MLPTDPLRVAALVLVCVALLQLILARWRDLGPLTVGAAGVLVLVTLRDGPPVDVWAAVSVSAFVAALAWARGAGRAVGHPALVGVTFGTAVAAGAAAVAVIELWPDAPLVGAAVVGVVASVATAVAIRSRSARVPVVRWVGEIPVRPGGK